MLYLKKSKTKLLSKFIICLFLLSILFTTYYIKLPINSYYNKNTTKITAVVTDITKTDYGYKLEVKAKENVIIYCKNFKGKLGNTIIVKGTFTKPNKNTNFNLFNYQNYLKSKKIYWIVKDADIKIIDKSQSIFKIKNSLIEYINKYKSYQYLNAFILGNDNLIDDDVYSSYQINGISHLVAISGAQIAFIAWLLLLILNIFLKNKNFVYITIIFILLFYMFLTGFIPPIVRAVLLFNLILIKKIINLEIDTIYLLLLITSFYLFYNPFIIMNIGFIFSFTISFYLILFSRNISNYQNYFSKTLFISIIAFLVSTPILIYNFHYINLLNPIINMVFIPFVSFIIYPLSVVCLIIPNMDNILFNFCKAMENVSLYIQNIDMFVIILRHINIYFIILYFILVTIIVYKISKKKYMYLVLFACIIMFHSNINFLDNNAYFTMIDVGQGDSFLISFENNKGNILIDTGGEVFSKKDIGNSIIIPYLKSVGIKKLDYLIITHGDYDHMGESINIINNFKINKVIFNCGNYNDLEKDLISVLENKKIKYYSCLKELKIDKYKLVFLNTDIYEDENGNSSVIYLNYNNYKFLFMGDATTTKEDDILKKYNISNVDFLKVGHHGSNTSSGKNFINTLNPKYSLISVGKNNMYGHPKKEVLNILRNSNIYRTDINGMIKNKVNKNGYTVETCTHE